MRRTILGLALVLLAAGSAPGGDPPPETSGDVMDLIAPRGGETIADVGCGVGTWTFPLARAVGESGKVFAVDIDPKAIEAVQERVGREKVTNVRPVHSVPDDPLLP